MYGGADSETGKPDLFEVVQCYERKTNELVVITIDDEEINTTRDHPFFVYEQGWRKAEELTAGTKLLDFDGNYIEVEKIDIVSKPTTVYNFEVAASHTYYISKSKLLVHNDCKAKKVGKRRSKSELNKIQGAIEQLYGITKAQRNGPGIEDITKSQQRVKNMLKWITSSNDLDLWYD